MRRGPYQAIYAAQRIGFSVKPTSEGPAASFYIEGPGNDGRGIFNTWYVDNGSAWRAVLRYVRKHGLRDPGPPPRITGAEVLATPYQLDATTDDATILAHVGRWLDAEGRSTAERLHSYLRRVYAPEA